MSIEFTDYSAGTVAVAHGIRLLDKPPPSKARASTQTGQVETLQESASGLAFGKHPIKASTVHAPSEEPGAGRSAQAKDCTDAQRSGTLRAAVVLTKRPAGLDDSVPGGLRCNTPWCAHRPKTLRAMVGVRACVMEPTRI